MTTRKEIVERLAMATGKIVGCTVKPCSACTMKARATLKAAEEAGLTITLKPKRRASGK